MSELQSSPSFLFAQSSIGSTNRIWFLAEADDAFHLMQRKDEAWAIRTIDWPVAAICGRADAATYEVFGVGINGELCHGSPGRFDDTVLTVISESSTVKGILRDIRYVGTDVVVVGMNRQVFARRSGQWRDVSIAMPSEDSIVGFNTVAGSSSDDFFVAGMEGEIFHFDGVEWRSVDSGTSVALTKLVMMRVGHFAVCGVAGTLMTGTASSIESVPNDATRENLYGLAQFKNVTYVASLSALYKVAEDGLKAVEFAFPEGSTFGDLEANDEVMYSVGAHHIYATDDGHDWRLIVCDQ